MKYFSITIIFVLILCGFWAIFIEPYILTIKYIVLENKDLSGLKIVYASDFHIKPYEKFRLKKVVKRINAQTPDIILLGGDFVNGHDGNFTMKPEDISYELKNLSSKYGTITVMGNHDGWQGKYRIIKALEANGIKVLENENINFDKFTIAGVEDIQTGNPNIEKALNGAGKNIILLSHTPDIFPLLPNNVILTLAGHLHCGQIVIPGLPPRYIPSKYGTKYMYGLTKENNKTLFTSRGLGNSILPMRFNCLPEIVVIEFK